MGSWSEFCVLKFCRHVPFPDKRTGDGPDEKGE